MKALYLFVSSLILWVGAIYLLLAYGDNIYAFIIILSLTVVELFMFLGWPYIFNARSETDGTIVFDTTDPHKDTISIIYKDNPLSMAHKNQVVLDVVNMSDSQETQRL